MRTVLAAAAGAAGAALLAGCGGGGSNAVQTTTTTAPAPRAALVAAGLDPPDGCYVTVFLVEDTTRAQVARVQGELLASSAVTEVSFVSKELELRRFAETNPKAARGMHVNPFADRFEVVPSSHAGVVAIVGHFAVHGGPITNVKPSRACQEPAG